MTTSLMSTKIAGETLFMIFYNSLSTVDIIFLSECYNNPILILIYSSHFKSPWLVRPKMRKKE